MIEDPFKTNQQRQPTTTKPEPKPDDSIYAPEQNIYNKKKEKIIKFLEDTKQVQVEEHTDELEGSKKFEISYPFVDELLRSINGHSGYSYETYLKMKREGVNDDQINIEMNNFNKRAPEGMKYGGPEEIEQNIVDLLRPKIDNELLIDLGCGRSGAGYALADYLNAAGYIGVDLNVAKSAQETCERIDGKTPFAILQEDVLAFLARFREKGEKAKTIIFSGIEESSYIGKYPYRIFCHNIIKNIEACLEDDGILIFGGNLGWAKEEYGDELNKQFKLADPKIKISSIEIYKKKTTA